MNRRNRRVWRWSRSIARETEQLWLDRMEARGATDWLLVEKPNRVRLSLEVYFSTRRQAESLIPTWGGSVRSAPTAAPGSKPGPPLRVNDDLEIVREKPKRGTRPGRLHIPYGMAFGSGEHATTLMLLRALGRRNNWAETTLLDLGTGSGVLALIARELGARKIAATDFDPNAIRTALQNEKLNFKSPSIAWVCADVKRLRSRPSYSLIVANLFSGILCTAAPRIVAALATDGELWLSGILRDQQQEVAAAYRGAGARLIDSKTRGKWVMQQWQKS